MSFNWKNRKLRVAALVFLMGTGATFASAQTTAPVQPPAQTQQVTPVIKAVPAAQDKEEARLKKYLDKNGGYKDNEGGYYDPKAGTYTDKEGGIVDNWQGYTYKDGSYKAATGDYWDAPTKTFKLASGEDLKSDDTTNEEAIQTLRETAAEAGKYNKDGIQTAMMARIKLEHPLVPVTPKKPSKPT
ncbi:MAG: hypothetical protein EPN97_04005 [Alphaproteobacteria bacterium]|nr:MAG: hypothetical protein EPN97_04005 [Alphaproteobacteria bacterium]